MAGGLDYTALCKGVADLLETNVIGIGFATHRIGGVASWVWKVPVGESVAYCEVSLLRDDEVAMAAGGQVEQQPTLKIELWKPFSAENLSTVEDWYSLLGAIKDTLRNNRKLGGLVHRSDPPGPLENDFADFEEKNDTRRCHHVVLLLQTYYGFKYTFA